MIEACGTFIDKGSNTYRTSAYIQWGRSSKPIGTVLMLNPGSATLKYGGEKSDNKLSGQIKLDPTMIELVDLVQSIGNDNIEGRLYIYNLFPLQNASKDSAIKDFNQLWSQNEILVRELPEERASLVKQFEGCPWVLIGWGCGNNSEALNYLKLEWLSIIKEAQVPVLGKIGKTVLDYYHPRPHLKSEQVLYKKEIREQYYSRLMNEIKGVVEPVSMLIADTSWMRHLEKSENVVEKITCGQYNMLFLDINEDEYFINYRYRILCFLKDIPHPILAINLEWSNTGTFFGVHTSEGHNNLGSGHPKLSFDDFIIWALEILPRYLKDLDMVLLRDKMTAPAEEIKLRKDQMNEGPERNNLIIIEDLMAKKRENFKKNIREYEDRYEYCLISEYEEKYNQCEAHSIQLGDVYPVVLETEGRMVIASVEFYKKQFDINQIITWLDLVNIYFGKLGQGKHVINHFGKLRDGLLFKGNLIISFYKGNSSKEINPNNFKEITSAFISNPQVIDTSKSKPVKDGLTIKVNGERIREIPRIEFDISKDIILSNGNLIVADYLEEYCEGIGFYKDEDPSIPIVFFLDYDTTIEIQIIPKKSGGKVCIIEHQYVIDVDSL